ncbi:acyltransferase [Seohaeicola zhoushanensis]|uniref:Acyltransferase n=1 Tax=Seohaeicola zhoushanensis TaxID=1569283 RepID=A0A8J3GVA9_9RHOB|nr:acyltransferase [Seohaeicola zhoushanensis]
MRHYGDTDFITGLRAIAATMVVIIHTGAFVDFGPVGRSITDAGKYGVDIFFVISGFTIAKTYAEARDYRSYLTRRIMRIVPLYWMMISVAIALWATGAFPPTPWMEELGAQPDLYNYLMHLSLLSYFDYRVANSLLGVEWTIPVEVFWYACLPLLLPLVRSLRGTVAIGLVMLVLTASPAWVAKKTLGSSLAVKWSPIAHGHLFLVGALTYHLRERQRSAPSVRAALWAGGALALGALALCIPFDGRSALLALCTAVLIVFVTPARAGYVAHILTPRPMLFLGSISYSIYLVHYLVVHVLGSFAWMPPSGLARFAIVYAITVVISTLTYMLVEKPTNRAGRRMAERLRV